MLDMLEVFDVVCTQSMANGLNLYLGSQSIYIVGFGFPIMGNPSLREQLHTRFRKPSFSPNIVTLILSIFSLELPTPFSQSILLFIA